MSTLAREAEACRRLTQVPGIGPLTATALVASIGHGAAFAKGARPRGVARLGAAAIFDRPEDHAAGDYETRQPLRPLSLYHGAGAVCRRHRLGLMVYHRAMRLRHHFSGLALGRRVALRALAAFLVTFAVLRLITAILHYDLWPNGPFHYVITKGGLHIHHLFWGVLLLMVTGFTALATRDPGWHLRIAVVYGIALGLTLDEFAMWLRLADVYWTPEGVESLKAAAVAAAFLAVYGFGQPFWHAVVRDVFAKTR